MVRNIGREGGSTPTNLDAENLSFCIIGIFSTMISSLRIVKHYLACSNTSRIYFQRLKISFSLRKLKKQVKNFTFFEK